MMLRFQTCQSWQMLWSGFYRLDLYLVKTALHSLSSELLTTLYFSYNKSKKERWATSTCKCIHEVDSLMTFSFWTTMNLHIVHYIFHKTFLTTTDIISVTFPCPRQPVILTQVAYHKGYTPS